jgi:hypothetical protein
MAVLAGFSMALVVVGLIWAGFDPRLIDGMASYAKPLKFAVSFVVLFGTMALVLPRFSAGWRDGRTVRIVVVLMTAAMVLEMGYMITQAAQGQASHFNTSSPYTAVMYPLMGIGAVTLVVAVGIFGWVALRDSAANMGPATRQGVGIGFIGSCILTLITAGTMSSMAGHFIGTPGPDAATFPLMGWSAAVGDLRPAHFVALHLMQVLPLIGLWIDRRGGSIRTLGSVAFVYAILTLALFVQALLGLPVIRL